jgi:RNA polymerase sigma-70 factor (ECF subfamily)
MPLLAADRTTPRARIAGPLQALDPAVSRSTPDGRVIARLHRGDEAAVHELYAEHGSRVVSYLASVLRDRAAAEDVCQEVFLEVWRKGSAYDPERGAIGAWIMTIARTRAIDHMRKRVPEPRDVGSPGSPIAETPDPAAAVEALDERWRVAGLLGELPEDQATVLRLRFHAEMSQSEIAATLGVPIGTVKTRMARALIRLRDLLDHESEER